MEHEQMPLADIPVSLEGHLNKDWFTALKFNSPEMARKLLGVDGFELIPGAVINGAMGQIIRRTANGQAFTYVPYAGSLTSREAALRAAIADAGPGDIIRLENCRARCTGGLHGLLSSAAPGMAGTFSLEFGPGSAILYDVPQDASYDAGLFAGQERDIENFGAVYKLDDPIHAGNTENYTAPRFDSSPAIESAYWSLPEYDGVSVETLGRIVRAGTITARGGVGGGYFIRQPIRHNAFIRFTPESINTRFYVLPRFGLAEGSAIGSTSGVEIFAIDPAQQPENGANFTHAIDIGPIDLVRLQLDELGNLTNQWVSAVRLGAAQISRVEMASSGFRRDLELVNKTTFVDLKYFSSTSCLVGPSITAIGINCVNFGLVSIVLCNHLGTNLDENGFPNAAVVMDGVRTTRGAPILVEQSPHGIYVKNTRGLVLSALDYYRGIGAGAGRGITLRDSFLITLPSLRTHSCAVAIDHINTGSGYSYQEAGNLIDFKETTYTDIIQAGVIGAQKILGTELTLPYFEPDFLRLSGSFTRLSMGSPTSVADAATWEWQYIEFGANPKIQLVAYNADRSVERIVKTFGLLNGLDETGFTEVTYDRALYKEPVGFQKGIITPVAAVDPVAADITDGAGMQWRTTASGEIRQWANDGAVMKRGLPLKAAGDASRAAVADATDAATAITQLNLLLARVRAQGILE